MKRALAILAAAALAAVALTGCVKNLPNPARDWLAGQDGVKSAEVLSDNTDAWSSNGLVRGELDPKLSDADIEKLIKKIQDFSAKSGGVAFWLGLDEVDFSVPSDTGDSTLELWHSLLDVDGVTSGIVFDDEVRARTLRTDASAALDAMLAMNAKVRLEAFADQAASDADRTADIQYDQLNPVAIEYDRAADCTPAGDVLDFAKTLVTRDDIPGATADLCQGITLDIPMYASFATMAVSLRSELDDRGLSDFSVQLSAQDANATRFAAVTPGDAKLLLVLAAFEAPGVPELNLSYSLGPDANLAVTGYSVPTADLVTLMQNSPTASGLAGIGLEGDPVAIAGTLSQLPALLKDANKLATASDAFGQVTLGQGFGTVYLQAPEGSRDPDVAKAAKDLRATGLVEKRYFTVIWAAYQVDIANNIATLDNPDYTDPTVAQAFVEAWNALN